MLVHCGSCVAFCAGLAAGKGNIDTSMLIWWVGLRCKQTARCAMLLIVIESVHVVQILSFNCIVLGLCYDHNYIY